MPSRRLQSHAGTRRLDARSPTCCVGHRGARAFAPENTLPAFRKAAALGCAAVELDVHLSRDGELVVHHDERLARCTDVRLKYPGRGDAAIADFDWAELQTLDAGSWYVAQLALPAAQRQAFLRPLSDAEIDRHVTPDERADYAAGEVRIPALAEVLQWARAADVIVNIEIKSALRPAGGHHAGIADKVVALAAAMDMRHSVLVSSFDHRHLQAVRRLDDAVPTGVLTAERLAQPADDVQRLDADAFHPGMDLLGFQAASRSPPELAGIASVRAAGAMTFVWTCNDVAQMRALIAAGVTGVITDYPNRFAEAAPPLR